MDHILAGRALVHPGRPLGVISLHYHSGDGPPRSRETFASTATLIAAIVTAGFAALERRP